MQWIKQNYVGTLGTIDQRNVKVYPCWVVRFLHFDVSSACSPEQMEQGEYKCQQVTAFYLVPFDLIPF